MSKTFNIDNLAEYLLDYIDDDFYLMAHQEFYKLMYPYIPFRTGRLASTTDIEVDEKNFLSDDTALNMGLSSGNITTNGILFQADYAEETYYNLNKLEFRRDRHPLATKEWAQVAFNGESDVLIKKLEDYLQRRFDNEQ